MKIRNLIYCYLFIIQLPFSLIAGDSIKYDVTYIQPVKDGVITGDYITINQKTRTFDGKLIREHNYDENSGQIKDYIFYFYKNGLLTTEETYNAKDILTEITRHNYNGTREVLEEKFNVVSGNLVLTNKTVNKFDAFGNIVAKTEYTKGKKAETTKFTYNNANKLIKTVSIFKNQGNLKATTTEYVPDNTGKNRCIRCTEQFKDKSLKITVDSMYYNEKGILTKSEKFDETGKILSNKIYNYYPAGSIKQVTEKDAAGKFISVTAYAYRKHFIILGTQKSYFDKD